MEIVDAEVQTLFPTPLLIGAIADPETTCTRLRERILSREAETVGTRLSNAGGWQSDTNFLSWGGDDAQQLVGAVVAFADSYTGVYDGVALKRVALEWRINAWANVNRKGHSNTLHYHPGAYWSATVYIDDGGILADGSLGGSIDFVDPRGIGPMMNAPLVRILVPGCANAGQGERLLPKTGMVLLFPSWLGHYVTPYQGGGTRISVAINLSA